MSLNRIYTGKGPSSCVSRRILAVEAIVAAGFLSLAHFKTSTNWATKSEQVLIELERMKSAMIGAETQQRGYFDHGDPRTIFLLIGKRSIALRRSSAGWNPDER